MLCMYREYQPKSAYVRSVPAIFDKNGMSEMYQRESVMLLKLFFCWNYFFATGHSVETSFENPGSELEGVLSRHMFFMFEDVGVRAIAVLTLCSILPGESVYATFTGTLHIFFYYQSVFFSCFKRIIKLVWLLFWYIIV
jgi:hypothetical protein